MIKKFSLVLIIVFVSVLLVTPVLSAGNIRGNLVQRLQNNLVLSVGSSSAYVNNQRTSIDPSDPLVQPIVQQGRVLVPLRFIGESLGAQVTWNPSTSTIELTSPTKRITLVIGQRKMTENGTSVDLDVPAQIISNRTFVPLRALAEALNKKVFYHQGIIIIGDTDKVIDPDNDPGLFDELTALFKERGNTPGNLVNRGLVAEKGDWIYYSLSSDEHSLYKVRKDGTGKVKLNNDWSSGLNLYDGWIYYINESDEGRIYKIKTDGTGRQRVNNTIAHQMFVMNGWIYYKGWEAKLYRMKVDGTAFQTLTSDSVGDLCVSGGWMYFTPHEKGYSIYKMRTDGTGIVRVGDKEFCRNLNVVGDWIFYGSVAGLCKIRTNGQDRTVVTEDEAFNVNVSGEWIYYSIENRKEMTDELYRIRPDGTDKTSLGKHENVWDINVIGDQLYYRNIVSFDIFKMKSDGSQKALVD